jgi:hypothetical protein
MPPYVFPEQDTRLHQAFAAAGKKLDMGKSCIRFRRLEDLELKPILDIIAQTDVESFVAASAAARPPKK